GNRSLVTPRYDRVTSYRQIEVAKRCSRVTNSPDMLAVADGACAPDVRSRRRGRSAGHGYRGRHCGWRPDRLGYRVARIWPPRRGGRRRAAGHLRGLPPLREVALMPSAMFNPRPEPNHLLPALAGGIVLVIALPVFLVAGWPIGGWALATVLYVAVHALDLVVTRLGNGAKVFGVLFKALGLLVVLLATAASDKDLAISAVLTYALAYTAEFGLS